MYAPGLGRFLQTDPIGYGDGLNWYGYVGGDPVNSIDPTGLETAAQYCGRIAKPENDPICDILVKANKPNATVGNQAGSSGAGSSIGPAALAPDDLVITGRLVAQNDDIVVTAKKYAKRFGQCVAAQYGFGDGAVSAGLDLGKIASEIGGIPLPKRLLGIPLAGGEGVSKFTNLISYVPFKLGIRANTGLQILGSGRVFGVLGRLNAPVAAALAAYDAASIAICTAGE